MLIYNGASTLINMISDGFIFALIGVPLSIRPPCFNCELIKQVTFPCNYHNNNHYHGHLYNRHHHLCMRKIISSASQRAIYSIRLLQAIYNSDVQKIVKRIFLSKAMPRFSEGLYKFVIVKKKDIFFEKSFSEGSYDHTIICYCMFNLEIFGEVAEIICFRPRIINKKVILP